MILIHINDAEFQRRLRGLLEALGDSHLALVLEDIGQGLIDGTKTRIAGGQDWQGRPFAPNTPVTLARKRGLRPLIDGGDFVSTRFFHRVAGHTVELHASALQAGVLYYGASKGQFGRGKTRNFPIPWGPIAPRPFFPFTDDGTALVPAGQEEVNTFITAYIEAAQR